MKHHVRIGVARRVKSRASLLPIDQLTRWPATHPSIGLSTSRSFGRTARRITSMNRNCSIVQGDPADAPGGPERPLWHTRRGSRAN